MCGGCLCSGISRGTASVDFVLDDVSNTIYFFLFPSVCGGCLCSGGSSGTASVYFVLDDVSNTTLISVS